MDAITYNKDPIRYRKIDWKYVLDLGVSVPSVEIDGVRYFHSPTRCAHGGQDIALEGGWVILKGNGTLYIRNGYAWNGASGPTVDTEAWMRPSLVHDALYQLMEESALPLAFRDAADRTMRDLLVWDGMSPFRAWYSYWGVALFGEFSARPQTPSHFYAGPQ